MLNNIPELTNYCKLNGVDNYGLVIDMINLKANDQGVSLSMLLHEIENLLLKGGQKDVKALTCSTEILGFVINGLEECPKNIYKIAQYAIDNDYDPDAMDRLSQCNLNCLNEIMKSEIQRN